MYTIYDDEKDSFLKVEEPDPSVVYTYADYVKWKFEERLELFRGRIFKLAAPNIRHQQIARELLVHIAIFLKGHKCQVFASPVDVRLPVKNRKKDNEVITVVQPDICIVCDESKIETKGICGAPDLIIEILSPGNSNKEIKLKFELYQEAGVKEYLIVYPEEESVAAFILNGSGKYDGASLYAGFDQIKSHAIPGLILNLTDIFTN